MNQKYDEDIQTPGDYTVRVSNISRKLNQNDIYTRLKLYF